MSKKHNRRWQQTTTQLDNGCTQTQGQFIDDETDEFEAVNPPKDSGDSKSDSSDSSQESQDWVREHGTNMTEKIAEEIEQTADRMEDLAFGEQIGGQILRKDDFSTNSNFLEKAGRAAGEQTYLVQENSVYFTYGKAEKAASYLTLASANHLINSDARTFERFMGNENKEDLITRYGLNTDRSLSHMAKALGIDVAAADMALAEQIAATGNFTADVKISDSDLTSMKDLLSKDMLLATDLDVVRNTLKSYGINTGDNALLIRAEARNIIENEGVARVTMTASQAQRDAAINAVTEKKQVDHMLDNGGTTKQRAEKAELISRKAADNIGVEGFTGKKGDMKNLKTKKTEDGRLVYTFNKKVISDDQARQIKQMETDGLLTENTTSSRASEIRTGILKNTAKSVIDEDTKKGMDFSAQCGSVAKHSAKICYRAAIGAGVLVYTNRANIASAANRLAEKTTRNLGKALGHISGENSIAEGWAESLTDRADALANKQSDLNEWKEYAKEEKALMAQKRKDQKELRGTKGEIRKDKKEQLKGDKEKLKNARKTRSETTRKTRELNRKEKLEKRKERRVKAGKNAESFGMRATRKTRETFSAVSKSASTAWKNASSKFQKSWAGRAMSKAASLGRSVGRGLTKAVGNTWHIATSPFRAVGGVFGKMTSALNTLKKVLFKTAAALIIGFVGLLFVILITAMGVGLIATIFEFLFVDDTNYGQILIDDLNRLQHVYVEKTLEDAEWMFENDEELTDEYASKYETSLTVMDAKVGNMYSEEGGIHKTANLGSLIPYFSLAKTRYTDSVDDKLYGTYKGYTFYLWTKNHDVKDYHTLDETERSVKVYYCNDPDCDNWYYHNANRWGNPKETWSETWYDNPLEDSRSTCDNYDRESRKDERICGYSYHWHGWGCNSKDCWHECDEYCKDEKGKCTHEHDWACCSKHECDDSCYDYDYYWTCQGHCGGHVRPQVDLVVYEEDVAGIAAFDHDTKIIDGKTMHVFAFAPEKSISGDVGYFSNNIITNGPLRAKNLKEWNKWWDDFCDTVNGGVAGINSYTQTIYKNLHKTYGNYAYREELNSAPWTQDMLDMAILIGGDYDTAYQDGVENWADFEVYFDEINKQVSVADMDAALALLEENNRSMPADGSLADQMIYYAFSLTGKINYDPNAESSVLYMNNIISQAGETFIEWTYEDYLDKAKNLNVRVMEAADGSDKRLIRPEPGSILIDKDTKSVVLYLGYDGNGRYQIADCTLRSGVSTIRSIGEYQIRETYTKYIPVSDINGNKFLK